MIIKGGSRRKARFFANHLLNTKDNQHVRVVEVKGFAHEDVRAAFRDMETIARGTHCANFFYHADINPQEGETLSEKQKRDAVDTLENTLGLNELPRVVIEHCKKGREHLHVVWQRIDPDTMTARSDSLTYAKHEAAAREIEANMGLEGVPSVLVKDRGTPRPQRRPKDYEGFRGVKTGINPAEVKAAATALWQEAASGQEFRVALAQKGYLLCRGDRRDFCIVDTAGKEHALRLNGIKAAEVRERMADVDRDALPSVGEARKERRRDGAAVASAVQSGADKKSIERVINASRASAVSPQGAAGDDAQRDAYEHTLEVRGGVKKEPAGREPIAGERRLTWQERLREEERGPER